MVERVPIKYLGVGSNPIVHRFWGSGSTAEQRTVNPWSNPM